VDATLLVKLKLAFEDKFRYDAAGVPKVWKPEDDIDGAFRTAREAVSRPLLIFLMRVRIELTVIGCQYYLDARSDSYLCRYPTGWEITRIMHSDQLWVWNWWPRPCWIWFRWIPAHTIRNQTDRVVKQIEERVGRLLSRSETKPCEQYQSDPILDVRGDCNLRLEWVPSGLEKPGLFCNNLDFGIWRMGDVQIEHGTQIKYDSFPLD
jgi:hypothetical protein